MSRRSAYEQRDLDRGGHTVVVQDGRILGVLDSRGELVPLEEPPADRARSVAGSVVVAPGEDPPVAMTDAERLGALEAEYAKLAKAAQRVIESAEPDRAADRAGVDAVELVRMRRILDGEPAPSGWFTLSIT